MATDPIRRVRERSHATDLSLDARETLMRLAALPPSTDAPYLTLSLDWRPAGADPGRAPAPPPRPSERRASRDEDGASRRPSRFQIERELAERIAAAGPRGAAFDSLSADAERVATYLDTELDPAAQGVFIVACAARDVFEPLALALPLPTRLTAGPTPALSPLARLVDDHPVYAVLLADQHEATLSLITKAARGESVFLESSTYPRKQKQGGWSQRRFQARADERVAAFARGIADEVRRTLDEAGVTRFVIAGDEVITSALDQALHPTVKDRVVDTLRLDIRAGEQEVVEATLPVVERAERDAELVAARALADAVGADARGAAGPAAVLRALRAGQVDTLVMAEDFAETGWADFVLETYGVGPVPEAHPLGGNPADLVPVALEEEMIRLALQTGAAVEIVHASVPLGDTGDQTIPRSGSAPPRSEAAVLLDGLGGVGALLRFTM